MKKINLYIICFFVITLFYTNLSFAQEVWTVPEADKSKVNPLKAEDNVLEIGDELFKKNCQSCHGEIGMSNGLPLVPPPIDLASDKAQANTAGELFYKITNGRGAMPTFATQLSTDQRWQIITFIKSFSATNDSEKADILKNVNIKLTTDAATHKISATLQGTNTEGEIKALAGQKINFYVKRYFGKMLINKETIKTNVNGVANIEFPKNIQGDTLGNVTLIVELDSKTYKNVTISEQLAWGIPVTPIDITEQCAMWGTRANAPWWILFLYLSITLGVWITIFYVIFIVVKIKKAGTQKLTA